MEINSKRGKVPYYIQVEDDLLFSIAGLWESYENIDGKVINTFMIITRSSDTALHKITDRIPLILSKNQELEWLNSANQLDAILDLLMKADSFKFYSYSVSTKVNNLANDGPDLILPAPPADQFGNYSLFD